MKYIYKKKDKKRAFLTDIFNMSKKTGKKNKKSKKAVSRKPINKKMIIYGLSAFCALLLIIGICVGVKISRKRKADRTVRIAFYGLSQDMTDLLKAQIPQEENIILDFDVISDGDFDLQIVKDKYDMLFTWRGEITDSLSTVAEDIPPKVLETMPNSLRNKKCVPVILDHCEFAFSKPVMTRLEREVPQTASSFTDYLIASKGLVFSPFFCNGAENRTLIDFVGAQVMSKGGLSSYKKLIEELRKAESLEEVIDSNLNASGLTLRSILDELKTWPKEGLTHPAWYNGQGNDLLYFAQEKQISCFFTLLSQHRKIPYNVIKDYESSLVPLSDSAENYGLIAPAVSVMLLSDNANCKRYITAFFTEDAQSYFSDKTNLAPVHYRAECYDRQADDVRFWAASCAGGAVPDLYLAVYQRKSKELEKMCSEIRGYIR